MSITSLLDQFNSIFGTAIFWGVLSLGFYIAFIVGEFMDNGLTNMLVDGVNLLSIMPYLTMVMAGAEVHRVASSINLTFKKF